MTSVGIMASAAVIASVKNVWNRADPTAVSDPSAYELGTRILVNSPCSLIGARVWNPGSQVHAGRSAKLWSTASDWVASAVQVRDAPTPDTLPAGWSIWDFPTPLVVASVPAYYVVSYDLGPGSPDYGTVPNTFGTSGSPNPLTTSDGKITFPGWPNEAGRYTTAPDTLPTNTFNAGFYGVDLRYQ